jgi:hypothetical protein
MAGAFHDFFRSAEPFGPERLMNPPMSAAAPIWRTASFGDSTDTLPMELSELGEHMDSCKGAHGRLFALQCAGEVLNRFIATRFVTTLVVATFVIGGAALAS